MAIIRKIRDHGITIILIEHHMDVVMSISDTVTVLDFGQKIAEGKPAAGANRSESDRGLSRRQRREAAATGRGRSLRSRPC